MGPFVTMMAAGLAVLALVACGDDEGAELDAPPGATIVLDFQPNAVHAPLYAAEAEGLFAEQGVEVEIREPGSTADGAKLLEAGRADLAVLDVNDVGIVRERGLDVVAVAALIQRPLASVITSDPSAIPTPADLAGAEVGVTGVRSDDAVLDTVLEAGELGPGSVDRVTIGFAAVPALASGRVDAATAFWNAEGVELRRRGVPIGEFRVDELGAPRYPELVLVARGDRMPDEPEVVCPVLEGVARSFDAMERDSEATLKAMIGELEASDPGSLRAQFAELIAADAFSPVENGRADPALRAETIPQWQRWATKRGVLEAGAAAQAEVSDGFAPDQIRECALRG